MDFLPEESGAEHPAVLEQLIFLGQLIAVDQPVDPLGVGLKQALHQGAVHLALGPLHELLEQRVPPVRKSRRRVKL